MIGKRPSVVGALSLDSDRPSDPDVAAPDKAEPVKVKAKADVQHTSVYIPRAVYERLREIAFHERVKIHDLIMEGLDRVIAERGHPERVKDSTKEL
jgi:hypothetical protein